MFVERLSVVLAAIYWATQFWNVLAGDFAPETGRYTEKLPQLQGKQRGGSGDQEQSMWISPPDMGLSKGYHKMVDL